MRTILISRYMFMDCNVHAAVTRINRILLTVSSLFLLSHTGNNINRMRALICRQSHVMLVVNEHLLAFYASSRV